MSVSVANFGVADPVLESHLGEKKHDASKSSSQAVLPNYEDEGPVNHFRPSFAEYLHWAALRREVEANDNGASQSKGIAQIFRKKESEEDFDIDRQVDPRMDDSDLVGMTERQIEMLNARRALRLAGWSTVFYLITCDILGPFNAPYAIAAMGLVPGILLYILFGIVAALGGTLLWKIFLRLDSARYPVKTYGDLADRIFGRWAKHLCSILASIQLILNVGIICLSNGQSLSQITRGKLCFVVCIVIWAACGMILGQVRGLQSFSIFANASVWINLLIIFLSMGFMAHSPPNYGAYAAQNGLLVETMDKTIEVVAVYSQPVFAQVNGVFNMVFAYGGAMIFPEIMAEMRRPRDFIKGMAMAQILIFTMYLLYGVFVYCYQGQFTVAVAYQGVSQYAWQTIGNVMGLITGIIAAGLYGNIGLKVFYINIIEDLFNGPPMTSRVGKYLWVVLVCVYWAVAFIIGTAIPSVGTLSGLVGAVCIFQFTYTFPPALMLGLDVAIDASSEDAPFVTPGVAPVRADSWKNLSRWKRGIFGGGRRRVAYKFANLLFLTAALATAGLGMWATGTDLRQAVAKSNATSFGCASNVYIE